jgi:hypothetical protein
MNLKKFVLMAAFTFIACALHAAPFAAQNGQITVGSARYRGYKVVTGNTWEFHTCLGNRVTPSEFPHAVFTPTNVGCPTSASVSSALDADGESAEDQAAAERREQAKKAELKSIMSQPR